MCSPKEGINYICDGVRAEYNILKFFFFLLKPFSPVALTLCMHFSRLLADQKSTETYHSHHCLSISYSACNIMTGSNVIYLNLVQN